MPPKQRHGKPKPPPTRSTGAGGRRSLSLAAAAAAGVIAVAGVLAYVAFGGSASGAKAALEAAGCSFQTAKGLEGAHTIATPGGTSPKWNTNPPTNGPHYPIPAIWGAYTDPLQPAQVVHNLEHGGIFIQYGREVPAPTVERLRSFYGRHQNGTLLAPLPRLGKEIALGAWVSKSIDSKPYDADAYLAKCMVFDEKAYSAFFAELQFRGPERYPASSLVPGT